MAITITLSRETERKLQARASQKGLEVSAYLGRLVEKEVQKPTLSEILAPFRQQVQTSGISDEELTTLFEEAREEVWQEKHQARPKP